MKNVDILSYQRWNNLETTLWNIGKRVHSGCVTFQCWTTTLHQCCVTLKTRFWILFHFLGQINVIWTVIYNVDATLIRRWNVGRVASMKKLILRTILPENLLTKWNLSVFFKDYPKTFAKTPVFTKFFWLLVLRIRLR